MLGTINWGGIENATASNVDIWSGISKPVMQSPEYFVLVVGIYIIQLIFLLTRFANGIDEGDDKVEYMYTLGKSMPTAVAFFSIVTIISMTLFQGMA